MGETNPVLNNRLMTSLEVKLDIIKNYYDSDNDAACELWTYIFTFRPNPIFAQALLGLISPSIRITGVDTETSTFATNTLDEVMSNTTNTTKLNFTYKDNSVIVTGSGSSDLVMFGALIPIVISEVIIKAECQGTKYKYTVPKLTGNTEVDTFTASVAQMAYPTFISE